jgi:hypothetical protein
MRWTKGAGVICGRAAARFERGRARRLSAGLLCGLLVACSPTVRVEPPEEPIVINMNVKIEHEIRVKVDKDLEQLFEEEDELF